VTASCEVCGLATETFNNRNRSGYMLDFGLHAGEQMPRYKRICGACIRLHYPETTVHAPPLPGVDDSPSPNGRLWRING
jgi:hypothetical protein